MIFQLIDLLVRNPAGFILFLPLFLLVFVFALMAAITVHEFSHALVADRLGDMTPRRMGRLSLNPIAHLDPIGTVLLFIVGFGWGKPVQVNPSYLRTGFRAGMATVSFAGPASNLITAGVLGLLVRLGVIGWRTPFSFGGLYYSNPEGILAAVASSVIYFCLVLAVFNLIPVAPLDGFKVALGLLPRNLAEAYARTETIGPIILLALIVLDNFIGTGILSRIIFVPADLLATLFIGRPL